VTTDGGVPIAPAGDLTVAALRARPVSVPLDPPVQTASGRIGTAPLVLIDLLTDEGVTGHSYVFCYTPIAVGAVADLLSRLEELIKGSPAAPVAIEARLQAAFRLLGPQGLTGMAMAGVDMAAWDALARAAGQPLVRLLGGEAHPVPAYGSLRTMDPAGAAKEAANWPGWDSRPTRSRSASRMSAPTPPRCERSGRSSAAMCRWRLTTTSA
jgi:mandelate racemase